MSFRLSPDAGPDLPQQLLSRFEIMECLAQNDAGQTLLVREKDSKAICVAKCVRRGDAVLEDEGTILQHLTHQRLPQYIGTFTNEHWFCSVRTFIEGTTLEVLYADKRATLEATLDIALQLCELLIYLHQQTPPVIHRDIKPQNIVVDQENRVYLIDFGISRKYKEGSRGDTVCFGTHGFAPPEQYGFTQTDPRADIYSLGVVMKWLLVGSIAEESKAALPFSICQILKKCIAFDPSRRYQDVKHLKKALLRVKREHNKKKIIALCLILTFALGAVSGLLLPPLFTQVKEKMAQSQFEEAFTGSILDAAAHAVLGIEAAAPLTAEQLSKVEALYIMGDTCFESEQALWLARESDEAFSAPVQKTDLTAIAHFPNLKALYAINAGLEDLMPLAQCPLLTTLDVSYNQIRSIEPLASLTNLRELYVYDNKIEDFSPVLSLPSLTVLDAGGRDNALSADLLPQLKNFAHMELLQLPRMSETELKNLSGMGVEVLALPYMECCDLSFVTEIENLRYLSVRAASITGLNALELQPNLSELVLLSEQKLELAPLAHLKHLKRLTLSQNIYDTPDTSILSADTEIEFR